MSTELEFLTSQRATVKLPVIRDIRDAPLQYPPVGEEAPKADTESYRRAVAASMQLGSGQHLRANRWAAFQKAICNLQLSPEEVTARVEQFFAPTPAPAEEAQVETPIGQ